MHGQASNVLSGNTSIHRQAGKLLSSYAMRRFRSGEVCHEQLLSECRCQEVLQDGDRPNLKPISWGCLAEVKYPPDPAYQACLKEKASLLLSGCRAIPGGRRSKKEVQVEDPGRPVPMQVFQLVLTGSARKVKTGGWFRTGGDDHPIAWKATSEGNRFSIGGLWMKSTHLSHQHQLASVSMALGRKVKGLAKSAGVKRGSRVPCQQREPPGYELIAIDGNQADWREDGYKAFR